MSRALRTGNGHIHLTPGGRECNLALGTTVLSLLSDSSSREIMQSVLCCQVGQPLNHDLQIKSPIVSSNKSFSEAFVQAHRIFIQVPGKPGGTLEVGDGFEVESNEILKPLCLDLFTSRSLSISRAEYFQGKETSSEKP